MCVRSDTQLWTQGQSSLMGFLSLATSQYAKTEGEGLLGRRPILGSVLAMKTRQALTENIIKRTKHMRARRNSSEGLQNDM